MRSKLILLFLSLFITFNLVCQNKVNKLPVPPNGVWLYENKFIDKTEIANIHWLEFMFYSNDSSNSYQKNCIPDSTVWNNYTNKSEVIDHDYKYLRNPFYRYYPVVGVTYEQIELYCKWRSEVVTKNINSHQKQKKYKVSYRLPTKKEWEFAAKGNLYPNEYPFGYKRSTKSKKRKKLNISIENQEDKPFLKDVYFGKENTLNIYNMIGNVAELIDEKGIAKGGSWMHELEKSKIVNEIIAPRKANWLGFRCIAEVKIIN